MELTSKDKDDFKKEDGLKDDDDPKRLVNPEEKDPVVPDFLNHFVSSCVLLCDLGHFHLHWSSEIHRTYMDISFVLQMSSENDSLLGFSESQWGCTHLEQSGLYT